MAIPIVVLISYLLLLLTLGLVSYFRSTTSEEDYYLAGREQGWFVSSLTIMATFFSSFALLGAPGKVYSEGVIFALFALNVPLSGACVYLFGRPISRLGRRLGHVTPGDLLADYYGGHAIRWLVAVTCILYVVPYVVIQIQAGGFLFETLIPEPVLGGLSNFTVGSILLATITTVYIMIGGMRSVAWTDALQGLLLISGMLLAGLVVVAVLGGLGEFSEKVAALPDPYLTAPGAAAAVFTPLYLLATNLFASSGTMVSPAQWMRYYAARSGKTLRRSALIFAIVLTGCFLFGVMLVGLGGRALYPEPVDASGTPFRPDRILVVVLHGHLPELWPTVGIWLSSLIITAIAAASMSTADSNLHALSAILTRDVYDLYFRPGASARESTWFGRGVIVVATLAALVLVIGGQPEPGGADDGAGFFGRSMKMIADVAFLAIGFSMQLLPITVDLLWIRRGSRAGAVLGLLAGLLVTPARELFGVSLPPGVWGLAANCVVFFAVSLFTRRPEPREELREAFRAR